MLKFFIVGVLLSRLVVRISVCARSLLIFMLFSTSWMSVILVVCILML